MKTLIFFVCFFKSIFSIQIVKKNLQNFILPNQFNLIEPFKLRNDKGESLTFTIQLKCDEDVKNNIQFQSQGQFDCDNFLSNVDIETVNKQMENLSIKNNSKNLDYFQLEFSIIFNDSEQKEEQFIQELQQIRQIPAKQILLNYFVSNSKDFQETVQIQQEYYQKLQKKNFDVIFQDKISKSLIDFKFEENKLFFFVDEKNLLKNTQVYFEILDKSTLLVSESFEIWLLLNQSEQSNGAKNVIFFVFIVFSLLTLGFIAAILYRENKKNKQEESWKAHAQK